MTIYETYNVDKTKLEYDYEANGGVQWESMPNGGKRVVMPPASDIEYLYLVCNMSVKDLMSLLNIGERKVYYLLKEYGLKKETVNRRKNLEAVLEEKYGVSNPKSASKETLRLRFVKDFLTSNLIQFETPSKTASDYGMNFYLPEVHIGLCLHKTTDNENLQKISRQAEENGIRLIHLWDYEFNQDNLVQKKLELLLKPKEIIYARKTAVKRSIEKEIKHWASLFYRIETNVKIPNTNLEIDIFIPELNIGIEVNGNYWHSELKRDRLYHKKKSEEAAKNGIFIYHIFEYEWTAKCEQIKAQLKNLLGKNDTKIYARKCDVRLINNVAKQRFLDENHLQGNDSSSVKLGLFYEDELVSVMTFCKPRFNKKYEWELSRFCSDWGCNVVGGASKLFNYFIKHYEPKSVISYSNNAHTRGELYEKLGFKLISESNPDYVWFKNGKIVPRYQAQKHRLLKQGLQGNSESEIMHELGYYRIYDCGNKVWVYEKTC